MGQERLWILSLLDWDTLVERIQAKWFGKPPPPPPAHAEKHERIERVDTILQRTRKSIMAMGPRSDP